MGQVPMKSKASPKPATPKPATKKVAKPPQVNIQVPKTKSSWATGRAERKQTRSNNTSFPVWFADDVDDVLDELPQAVKDVDLVQPQSEVDCDASTDVCSQTVSPTPLSRNEAKELRKVEKKLHEISILE